MYTTSVNNRKYLYSNVNQNLIQSESKFNVENTITEGTFIKIFPNNT